MTIKIFVIIARLYQLEVKLYVLLNLIKLRFIDRPFCLYCPLDAYSYVELSVSLIEYLKRVTQIFDKLLVGRVVKISEHHKPLPRVN